MGDYPIGSLRPTGRGQEVVVVAPTRCRNGHELGPGKVKVDFVRCGCDKARHAGHTAWTCNECGDRIVGDGHWDDMRLVGNR